MQTLEAQVCLLEKPKSNAIFLQIHLTHEGQMHNIRALSRTRSSAG